MAYKSNYLSPHQCLVEPLYVVEPQDLKTLREIFEEYASHEKDGNKYMTDSDFIRKYLGLYTNEDYNKETVRLLASAVDLSKDGFISFDEFCEFETGLCAPDALNLTAFKIFENNASESVTADEFEKVIRYTMPVVAELNFDSNSDFIKRYFGANKSRSFGYFEFCQFLHAFYEEQGVQAFKKFDTQNNGSISAADFYQIMTKYRANLLTDFTRNNLIAATGCSQEDCKNEIWGRVKCENSGTTESTHKIDFPFYQAFNSLLGKMELIKKVYLGITKGNVDKKVTKEEFIQATQAQFMPYEVEILFYLGELYHPAELEELLQSSPTIDFQLLKAIDPFDEVTGQMDSLVEEFQKAGISKASESGRVVGGFRKAKYVFEGIYRKFGLALKTQ